ncbi:Sel1 repeat-containing protein [Cardiosporidium cionae]|uniref:Sel1 repeat-containing protein n=1 Tax=Cardiosporidium cionae TaxID=476202 RepID=A0ABQ7J6N2_9APIC|nr:Sel1 repeat-containing protein [Cardiosporidium cionae]|eukprot:KAF8819646.1 Sel1 repeat-containing protein [Cardiosporidium cionae]
MGSLTLLLLYLSTLLICSVFSMPMDSLPAEQDMQNPYRPEATYFWKSGPIPHEKIDISNAIPQRQYYAAIEALKEEKTNDAFLHLLDCAIYDIRCLTILGEYHFLARPPVKNKNFATAVLLWKWAADRGSADAQFYLYILYNNLFNMPNMYPVDIFEHNEHINEDSVWQALLSSSQDVLEGLNFTPLQVYYPIDILKDYEKVLRKDEEFVATTKLWLNEDVALTYLFSASLAGHHGALMAMGYRYEYGYGVPQSCSASVLYYFEVAKSVIKDFSTGIPDLLETISMTLPTVGQSSFSPGKLDLTLQNAENGDRSALNIIGKGYLFGIYGLKQDYHMAQDYFLRASQKGDTEATALLGYMHALGLGFVRDLDTAAAWFEKSSTTDAIQSIGENGLGYVYFFGTSTYKRNLTLAFDHFFNGALQNLADAQYNLAVMYLTGAGTRVSLSKALDWFSSAFQLGHVPAAFSLVMLQLNGLTSIVAECPLILSLLKRMCRGNNWSTHHLKQAHKYHSLSSSEEEIFLLLQVAESGNEATQGNVALLLEKNAAIFGTQNPALRRVYANRYLLMAAEQGSILAQIKLGDYYYYGWGVQKYMDSYPISEKLVDDEGNDMSEWVRVSQLSFNPTVQDYAKAFAAYKAASQRRIRESWMAPYVMQAAHNVGFMLMLGIGVQQDLSAARSELEKVFKLTGFSIAPIRISLWIVKIYTFYLNLDIYKENTPNDAIQPVQ